MPITLNHSNISVQYSSDKSYIIETVKSDLYRRNEIVETIVRDNIQVAPVTPTTYVDSGNIYAVESYTYSGSANTADFTRVFTKNTTCDILVVGGGGGGGVGGDNGRGPGGGGAGQFLLKTNYIFNIGTYNIKTGRGGLGGNITTQSGETGKNSSISTVSNTILLESSGGGGGARGISGTISNGLNGASGGGGCGSDLANTGSGGTASIQFVNNDTLYTGYNGASGGPAYNGGGGGGYTSAGFSATTTSGGDGGYGITNNITGVVMNYCAGGGGGAYNNGVTTGTRGGNGGNITAGNGGKLPGSNGGNATNGSGSGGGGGGPSAPGGGTFLGGNGGSGIVIIRYLLGTIPATNVLTNEPVVIAPTFTETIRTFAHSGGAEAQTTHTITIGRDTICDILIVGGGGSGDREVGGGGGGGAVLYATNITIPVGSYTLKVGKGGENGNGGNSEAFGAICLGGGSTDYVGWGTANNGKAGGSGSGASAGSSTVTGGTVGTSTKGTLLNSGTLYNGNVGGNALVQVVGTWQAGGGGGGGAGTAGLNSTQTLYNTRSSWLAGGRPSSGGNGVQINITGTSYYWGAGGGGAGHYGSHAGDGGLGGGGGGGGSLDGGSIAGLAGTDGLNSGENGINTGTQKGGNGAPNTGSGGGGGGYGANNAYNGGNGGSGIVIIKFKSLAGPTLEGITHKTLNFAYDNKILKYDFTNYNTEATWKAYAATIPNFTYFFNNWFKTTFYPNSIYGETSDVGWFQMTLPSGYNYVSVFYGSGGWNSGQSVRLLINGVEKSSVINATNNVENTTTYSQAYTAGDILRVEETYANITSDIIITLTNTNPNIYTLNFPVPTIADINNNSNIVLRGEYDIAFSTSNSLIIPKSNQYIPKPTTFNNYSVERMYPPVRNFTAATTAVSGQTYGNGTYVVSYSSSAYTGLEPWTCFNTSLTSGGHWGESRYNTSGVFNSTSFIVSGYLGDWVKIQLPVAIKLSRFSFLPRTGYSERAPKDFKIYGSNDNITWVELVNKTDAVYNASSIYEQTTPEITNTYSYYGLVVNKIFIGTSGNTLNFDEWYIYGQELLQNSLSIRYNLLNPILDPIGAQWTYSSNNTNVYHMGSVGIGTKSPEYQLDVRGAIYSSVGGYTQTGLTSWSITSDRRIKENITRASYDICLENVKNIELYNFNFKNNCVNTNDKHQLGFIAQEVQQVYPKAVEVGKMILNTNEAIDDILTLNTTQIDYTLYGAVKNLIEKIEGIDNELENIEKLI